MLVLIMLTFSCHALCNCQGARGLSSEPSQPDAGMGRRSRSLPRKEVIQPHLPVRLPCYDFTPLTLHTFDASAPEGFGRRLRVQTTRVARRAVCTRPGNVFTAAC